MKKNKLYIVLLFFTINTYSQRLDSVKFYKITNPFFTKNINMFTDLNINEYSKIVYKSNLNKNNKYQAIFDYGFVWRLNKTKNLIIEYTLKNDNHLSSINNLYPSPEYSDIVFWIQDYRGKLHKIFDTIHLSIKIDSINVNEKNIQEKLFYDSFNRLVGKEVGNTLFHYEYDKNNNIIKTIINSEKSQYITECEYIGDKVIKIKYLSPTIYPYLINGLFLINEYKYNNYSRNNELDMNIIINETYYQVIEEPAKQKIKYSKYIGISNKKTYISLDYSNSSISTITFDYINPKIPQTKIYETYSP